MQNDDELVGRVLTRREIVRLLGAGGAAALAFRGPALSDSLFAQGAPGCVVKPEQTEGPYFVDQQLVRSDIRTEPSTGAMKPGRLHAHRRGVLVVRGDGAGALGPTAPGDGGDGGPVEAPVRQVGAGPDDPPSSHATEG